MKIFMENKYDTVYWKTNSFIAAGVKKKKIHEDWAHRPKYRNEIIFQNLSPLHMTDDYLWIQYNNVSYSH